MPITAPPQKAPEQIVQLVDKATGLNGFVVVHSTQLGPAAGGCRLWRYSTTDEAAADALRLAEGMTYKNALAGLRFGGGVAVLQAPMGPCDRRALFRAFGRAVNELGGRYVTAEDVGTTVEDMVCVSEETRFVAGLPRQIGRAGGDPSSWTARGVFDAMQVAVQRRLGVELRDVTVAVQGLGHVGWALCQLLHAAGARLHVADLRASIAARAQEQFGAVVQGANELIHSPADVFAPCALGGVLNAASIRQLRAKVVCGAAHNQLASVLEGRTLAERDILYAPDFLVNAGGIINVAGEYLNWPPEGARGRIDLIGARLAQVFNVAEARRITPYEAAHELAISILKTQHGSESVASRDGCSTQERSNAA